MGNKILTDRQAYYDILRFFATFAVMILHIAADNWYGTDIHSFEWNISNFYDSIVRWRVPVFTMISGALFLSGNQPIERIYKKNISRIITAFLFWSLFYASISFVRGAGIKSALDAFINGHYHMWFLFMIVGLYMVIPFLRLIVKDNSLMKYFLILAFIFAIVIPEIISVTGIVNDKYSSFMQGIIDKVSLNFVLGYTIYFILGYYFSRKDISRKFSILIYALGIVGFSSTVIFTAVATRYQGKPSELFFGNFTVNVFLEAVCIFVFCKNVFSKIKFSEKAKGIIFLLSKYSFGAYLIHPFVISVLKYLGLNTLTFNSLLAVPIIGVIVFCGSFLISGILNHIPILNKYIV